MFPAFDPIERSRQVEKVIINGDQRKYNTFRLEPFYGQIATARGVGCNLQCAFCWINPSKDHPENYGAFYSPQEVYDKLIEISSNRFGRAIMTSLVRISGCEPTLGKEHLLSFLELCKKEINNRRDFRGFLLETNGILLGNDEKYIKALSEFKEHLIVRLSFKAGTPEEFERKTGARKEFFDLPFRALESLKRYGFVYRLASMSQDPALMPPEERSSLLERIVHIGIENLSLLEEERTDLFGIAIRRLTERGIDLGQIGKRVYLSLPNGISLEELKNVTFETIESPCSGCTRNNPYHGHNTEDDLDEKLI